MITHSIIKVCRTGLGGVLASWSCFFSLYLLHWCSSFFFTPELCYNYYILIINSSGQVFINPEWYKITGTKALSDEDVVSRLVKLAGFTEVTLGESTPAWSGPFLHPWLLSTGMERVFLLKLLREEYPDIHSKHTMLYCLHPTITWVTAAKDNKRKLGSTDLATHAECDCTAGKPADDIIQAQRTYWTIW